MQCPLCRERPARRQCPGVGQRICSVCCGTKRLGEIACPADCAYLAASQVHPAAAVRKQQEQDVGFIMAMREGLSTRESELFWAFLTFLAGFKADPLVALEDEDLAEAAASLAATYETANRGVIYEHRPTSMPAQRLMTEMKAFVATLLTKADAATVKVVERDAAVVLRHIERGAVEARKAIDQGPATALTIVGRVVAAASRGRQSEAVPPSPIEPPRPMLIEP